MSTTGRFIGLLVPRRAVVLAVAAATIGSVELARGALISGVRAETSVEYESYTQAGQPPDRGSDTKIIDHPSSAVSTLTAFSSRALGYGRVSGGGGTLEASSSAEVASPNEFSFKSYAAGTASTGLFADGETYEITGVWGVSGGGIVRAGGSILNTVASAGEINGWTIPNGTSLGLSASAGSGTQISPLHSRSTATLTFVAHRVDLPPLPLPGKTPEKSNIWNRVAATLGEIGDYLDKVGDKLDEFFGPEPSFPEGCTDPNSNTAVCAAVPIIGTYLTPVVGPYGQTEAVYVGPDLPSGDTELLGFPSPPPEPTIVATSYRFRVTENLFTHFILPFALPGGDSELLVEVGDQIVPYAPGTLFDFTAYDLNGVSEFFLSGIDFEEGFLVNEVSPFVSGFRFAHDGVADIRITAADVAVLVPEPDAILLTFLGVTAALLVSARGTTGRLQLLRRR